MLMVRGEVAGHLGVNLDEINTRLAPGCCALATFAPGEELRQKGIHQVR